MKQFVLFIVLLFPLYLFAELKDCQQCATKKYAQSDIEDHGPDELRWLRNEIFARRGYIFSDSTLALQFSWEKWYKPLSKNVTLNEIEKHNVQLFKRIEKRNTERLPLLAEKLIDFLSSAKKYGLYKEYPQISDSLDRKQHKLFYEILEQFDPTDIRYEEHPISLEASGTDDGFVVRYFIQINGYDIQIGRHTDCSVEDKDDHCPEYSEIFLFRFKNGRIVYKEYVLAG